MVVSVSSALAFTCRMIPGNRGNVLLAQEPSVLATYYDFISQHHMLGGAFYEHNCVSEHVIVAEITHFLTSLLFWSYKNTNRAVSLPLYFPLIKAGHTERLPLGFSGLGTPCQATKPCMTFKTSPFILQYLFRKERLVSSQLACTTAGLQQFLGVCPLQNACTLGATSSSVQQHLHLHFVLVTDFFTLAWMPPLKACASCLLVQRPFLAGHFPCPSSLPTFPELSVLLLRYWCSVHWPFPVSELFFPFCSSHELCDATQLLIFSGIVAEVH